MATKYPWTGNSQADDQLANSAVMAEALAAIPELKELSADGRIKALIAELAARLTGIANGAMSLTADDMFGANANISGPTAADPSAGPAFRVFPHRGTLANPTVTQNGDAIGSVQFFGFSADESIRLGGVVVDVASHPASARYYIKIVRVAGQAQTEVFRLDGSVAADETPLLLYDVTAGTLKRVSRGAADSGGAGFRLLRIPN